MTVLRASILGGVDGTITSFAVVAGADAGALGASAALVVGASSVLADGLSMGVSEYLSSTSERAAGRDGARPVLLGLACFASFVACGAVPLAVFVLATGRRLLAAAMFALVELMLLGARRTRFTDEPLLVGLAQTAALGAAAGGVAYGVGVAVRGWVEGA